MKLKWTCPTLKRSIRLYELNHLGLFPDVPKKDVVRLLVPNHCFHLVVIPEKKSKGNPVNKSSSKPAAPEFSRDVHPFLQPILTNKRRIPLSSKAYKQNGSHWLTTRAAFCWASLGSRDSFFGVLWLNERNCVLLICIKAT